MELYFSLSLALGEPIFAPFDAPFRALPLIKPNRRPNYTEREMTFNSPLSPLCADCARAQFASRAEMQLIISPPLIVF
jgi:hypothetical protein